MRSVRSERGGNCYLSLGNMVADTNAAIVEVANRDVNIGP